MDIDDLLVQVATKVTSTYNIYGDRVAGATSQSACLYRDISTLTPSSGNRYGVDESGILWFSAGENVQHGDVYLLDGVYYKVEQILMAQSRVTDNILRFIKCTVSRTRQIS